MVENNCPCGNPRCVKHIICKYRRYKGKIIYPKKGDIFSFCIEDKEKAASSSKDITA